ncbi:MAG TPA: hypothetical protein VJN72_11960, partial [Gaiellales bacterium]|nr:hypothetical protein [Gaiellales bacterium]
LTHTFTFTNAELATVTATVKKGPTGTTPCTSATVTVTGGPFSGAPWNFSASATTNSSGVATIPNVPVGSGYTIKATKSGWSTATSTTTTVASGTTVAAPNPLLITGTGSC